MVHLLGVWRKNAMLIISNTHTSTETAIPGTQALSIALRDLHLTSKPVNWKFQVSIWKHLPIQLSNDILKMVLGHVPEDRNTIPSAS